jgi:hypothetical protein
MCAACGRSTAREPFAERRSDWVSWSRSTPRSLAATTLARRDEPDQLYSRDTRDRSQALGTDAHPRAVPASRYFGTLGFDPVKRGIRGSAGGFGIAAGSQLASASLTAPSGTFVRCGETLFAD